jgi:hypothetical protein
MITPSRDKWGQYQLPDGRVVKMEDVSEQWLYDSEILPVAITAGQEFRLCVSNVFSTGAIKVPGIDYNLPEFGRVPLGWYYSIQKIGFHLPVGIPSFDLRDISNNGYMQFITGGQKNEADGLILHFPTGIGIGGAVALDGGGVANEVSALNVGTPAIASVPARQYTIELPEQTSFELRLRFPNGTALSAATHIYYDMKVLRFRPVV